MTSQARAALMRLRDRLRAEGMREIGVEDHWNTGYRAACQQWCDWIDRELAALPADEAAGASAGLVEAAEKVVGNAVFVGHQYEKSVRDDLLNRLREALAAERARKPQPDEQHPQDSYMALRKLLDERDKTIAELRSELDIAAADRDQARTEEAEAALVIAELREAATKRETLIEAMRSVLRDTATAAGAAVTDATTDDLLAHLPMEVAKLRERLRQAHAAEEIAQGALPLAVERYKKAEAEAARYRETLVSKHGGEPLALLDELDEARAQLAEARKAGLRELQAWVLAQINMCEITIGLDDVAREIDRILAADQHNPPCGDTGGGCGDTVSKTETPDDATLREFVEWFESPGRHDIQPPVRAAYVLAKRARWGLPGAGERRSAMARKIKCKIALAVDCDGDWVAGNYRINGKDASEPWCGLADSLQVGERRYWVEVEVEVPEIATVKATAEEVGDGEA